MNVYLLERPGTTRNSKRRVVVTVTSLAARCGHLDSCIISKVLPSTCCDDIISPYYMYVYRHLGWNPLKSISTTHLKSVLFRSPIKYSNPVFLGQMYRSVKFKPKKQYKFFVALCANKTRLLPPLHLKIDVAQFVSKLCCKMMMLQISTIVIILFTRERSSKGLLFTLLFFFFLLFLFLFLLFLLLG
jgi:hypothetical protein